MPARDSSTSIPCSRERRAFETPKNNTDNLFTDSRRRTLYTPALFRKMTLTIDIESRKHYLVATVSGQYSLRGAQEAYDRAIKAALPLGHTRILIDARGITGAPSQDERYALGLFVATEQRLLAARTPPCFLQVAVYGHQPLVDPNRFGETVALNRGAKLKVSERLDEALAWLGVTPEGR